MSNILATHDRSMKLKARLESYGKDTWVFDQTWHDLDLYQDCDQKEFVTADPVNRAKVTTYVEWKLSKRRAPLYWWAKRHSWIGGKHRGSGLFMAPWYWLLNEIMDRTEGDVMRGALNSSELMAAGLMLSQDYVWYTPAVEARLRHRSLARG